MRPEEKGSSAHSNRLLDAILTAASEFSIISTDSQGLIMTFSRGAERMLGYSADEIVGKQNPLLFHDKTEVADRGRALSRELGYTVQGIRVFSVLPEQEGAETREWVYVRRDGTRLHVSLTVTAMRSGEGRITGYLGIAHDITELKQTEDKFTKIFLTTPNSIAITTLSRGMIVDVNKGFEDTTGWKRGEAIGKTAKEISFWVDPRQRERMVEDLRAGRDIQNREFEFRKKDGTVRHGTYSARTIQIVGQDHSIFVLQDVTERKETERILRQNEERLRGIATNMPGIVFQFYGTDDGHWGVTYASERLTEFFDLPLHPIEEAFNRFAAHIHPDDLERFQSSIQQAIKAAKPWNFEGRFIRPSGGTFWFHGLSTPTRHADRIVFNGILLDITERKQAEEAIRQSEDRYRTIFEKSATANAIMAEDTTILLVNSNFEKLVGYTKEQMEGRMSWTRFVLDEHLEQMKQYHVQRRSDPNISPQTYEFKGKIRSGEIRDFFMSVTMIPGTRESMVNLIDITDRKRAEEALRQSEDRYRTIFEKSATANAIVSENATILLVNSKFEKLVGYTKAEIEGKMGWTAFVQDEYLEMMNHYWVQRRIDPGSVPSTYEFKGKSRIGEIRDLSLSIALIPGTNFAIAHVIDITEQKRQEEYRRKLEQQLHHSQKLDAIGQLASGVAHDFNNILTGIQGNVSLMQMDYYREHPHNARLRQIEEQVKRGANLTRQLLGFARGGKYEVKTISVNDLIRKTTQFYLETKKEIQANMRLQEDIYPVEADAGQIEQVLLNLFINAGHAMPKGGSLHIQTANITLNALEAKPYEVPAGNYVKISVSDTGTGMSKETLVRIFEPFFTTKSEQGGSGLGLASCYGIMRNHGGTIQAYSEPGEGSTFSLYFPSSLKHIEAEGNTPDQPPLTGSGSILVVDDEPIILETASILLEALGYAVSLAAGGEQAIDTYRKKHADIDLVILDMVMPGISGPRTLQMLKEIDPKVKVILSSGYGLQGEVQKVMESGCLAFIQKPYILSDLSRLVHQVLHSAAQPSANLSF